MLREGVALADVFAERGDIHNAMLGVKEQVVAQYGDDSDAVQSLGLTPALSLSK